MPLDGRKIPKVAKKNGLRVEMGKGDHCKVYGPVGRGYMVFPLKPELSRGVENAVVKWFKQLGIILMILFACSGSFILLVWQP